MVREVFDAEGRSYATPSHRLALVEPDAATVVDPRPALIIGSDHAHVDMWSMVVVVRDLLTSPEDLPPGRAPRAGLHSVPAFAEDTAALADGPPAQGVRLIALATAALTGSIRDLANRPLRAVFPVHNRYEDRWHDAVGWSITNAVLESWTPEPAECSAAVRWALGLGSWPLGPILAPWGGMPQAPGMFAVSWLDTRRLPVHLDPAPELQYVSARIRTDGVMIWFVVNDSGLHLRCHPDTRRRARTSAAGWTRWSPGSGTPPREVSAGGAPGVAGAQRSSRAVISAATTAGRASGMPWPTPSRGTSRVVPPASA